MPRPIPSLLTEARRVLGVSSQGAMGELLGSSKHTGQRWETGRSAPMDSQLHELARRVYPRDPDLARQIALAGDSDLVTLGIAQPAAPPPAPLPPPPPLPPAEDVVDAVVCAAAEAMNVMPRDVRPALLAAFTRARRIGLSLEAVEKALAGVVHPVPGAKKGAATAG